MGGEREQSFSLSCGVTETGHPVGLGAPLIALDGLKGKEERG